MEINFKNLIIIAFCFFCIYIFFSFIELNINPFLWEESVRVLYILFSLLASSLLLGFYNDTKK